MEQSQQPSHNELAHVGPCFAGFLHGWAAATCSSSQAHVARTLVLLVTLLQEYLL